MPCASTTTGTCGTAPQCGCSTADNCVVVDFSSGNTGCISPGSTQPYQQCSFQTDCAKGSFCYGGVCKVMCDADAGCSGDVGACKQVFVQQQSVPQLFYCTHTCNPVNPQVEDGGFHACGPQLKCLPAPDGASDCFDLGVGTGMQGTPCGTNSPDESRCAIGYACVTSNGTNFVCAKYCRVAGADCGALSCAAFQTPLYTGGEEIGICL